MWRAWSWRATDWAVRSGIRRGFWTALPRLPKCRERRAEAGLLEPAGTRTTTRRMGQQREAEAMGWMARNTGPNAPPQRPGKGAAGARVSPCARRGGWGSAGVVLAPAMAPPRSADSVVRVWWCPWGSSAPQRPMRLAIGSGAGCGPVPEVPLEQRPVPATARSALVAWRCRSAGSAGAPGCRAAGGPGPQQ